MTEADWLQASDPAVLLRWLQKNRGRRPTPRKMGLFACACARRLGGQVADQVTAFGLALAERLAEGEPCKDEYRAFLTASLGRAPRGPFTHVALRTVHIVGPPLSGFSPEGSARSVAGYCVEGLGPEEAPRQVGLLRDVLGNPYRRGELQGAWRTDTVCSLAQAAYEDRALPGSPLNPQRLAVLSDALEEAGCDNSDILEHLRSPGPHVRGCWALDLLLGKV